MKIRKDDFRRYAKQELLQVNTYNLFTNDHPEFWEQHIPQKINKKMKGYNHTRVLVGIPERIGEIFPKLGDHQRAMLERASCHNEMAAQKLNLVFKLWIC